MIAAPPTLSHRLAGQVPDRCTDGPLFRFLDDNADIIVERPTHELLARSRQIAHGLLSGFDLQPGQRVVLVYLPSLDFVEGLLACIFAGIVPVSILPPDPLGSDVAHLNHVVENAQACAILTHRGYHRARMFGRLGRLARLRGQADWPALPWLLTDTMCRGCQQAIHLPGPAELAFLQYTSGSTGRPRGVRVSHGNLAHNLDYQSHSLMLGPGSEMCCWVPQYHDFGLVGGILSSLWAAASLTLISPFSFLKRPAVWAEAMHRYGTTHTPSPNFALDLMVRKTTPRQRAGWDLSRLRNLGIGGEPVQATTVARFEDAFAISGLRKNVLCGTYGLAEHVAYVCGASRGRISVDPVALNAGTIQRSSEPHAHDIVSTGLRDVHVRIKIVDPHTRRPLPEGKTGEVWVDSPSKVDGYEGDADNSSFTSVMVPDDGHRYLRTGDLGGFFDDQLYVTGRLKELIIIRGHNLVPTDLETAAQESHPAIRPGRLAAFGIDRGRGTEGVVLFVELRDAFRTDCAEHVNITAAVRTAVSTQVPGASVDIVVLGSRGLIDKTTSGKVQRLRARQRFLAPGFEDHPDVLHICDGPTKEVVLGSGDAQFAANQAARGVLVIATAKVLGRAIKPGDLKLSARELGLDSLQASELQSILEEKLGEPIAAESILTAASLEQLLETIGCDDGPEIGLAESAPGVYVESWREYRLPSPLVSGAFKITVMGTDADTWASALAHSGQVTPETDSTGGGDGFPVLLVLTGLADGRQSIEGALEQCRSLAQQRQRSCNGAPVIVLTRGGVAASRNELPDQAGAAVWGFYRSLRRELDTWRIRDLPPLREAQTDIRLLVRTLRDSASQLALRGENVLAPTFEPMSIKSMPPLGHDVQHPFGGTALLVGAAGDMMDRAALWLVRTRAVTRIVTLEPGADKLPWLAESQLRQAGIEIIRLHGSVDDRTVLDSAIAQAAQGDRQHPFGWVVLLAEHAGAAPVSKQTRGRVAAAFAAGVGALENLCSAAIPKSASIIVLGDLAAWAGPALRAGWAASCAALQAHVMTQVSKGRVVKCVAFAPREEQVPKREFKTTWTPAGIAPLASGSALPGLDFVLARADIHTAGVWSPLPSCLTKNTSEV